VKVSSVPGVVSTVRNVTTSALSKTTTTGLAGIFCQWYIGLLRATVFRLYVAGEEINDCRKVSERLVEHDMRIIVDHSTEEKTDTASWANNIRSKAKLFQALPDILGRSQERHFVPIKITGLASPHLLEKMSRILTEKFTDSYEDTYDHAEEVLNYLTAEELALYRNSFENLSQVCEMGIEAGVGVLLDAEETNRQPAIDLIAMNLMKKHNRVCPNIYNTFQMYLRGGLRRLRRDVEHARIQRYHSAFKLVRGAYMVNERLRATKLGKGDPIMISKAATDDQYNAGLELLLHQVASSKKSSENSVSVLIATHNRKSIENALAYMDQMGISCEDERVHFAQIMGLCDNLGHALGDAGYNAHKLVLFGTFEEVFPWLLRRLDENQDTLGATLSEAGLLRTELVRRVLHPF